MTRFDAFKAEFDIQILSLQAAAHLFAIRVASHGWGRRVRALKKQARRELKQCLKDMRKAGAKVPRPAGRSGSWLDGLRHVA